MLKSPKIGKKYIPKRCLELKNHDVFELLEIDKSNPDKVMYHFNLHLRYDYTSAELVIPYQLTSAVFLNNFIPIIE